MTPARLALLSLLGAIFGTLAILTPVLLISWQVAVSSQRGHVERSGARVLARADAIHADAAAALAALLRHDAAPCSAQHVEAMQRIALASLNVNNIAYINDDGVECSAFGTAAPSLRANDNNISQADGIELIVNRESGLVGSGPMLIMMKGAYSVLVDQRHFYDEVELSGVIEHVAVTTLDGTALQPTVDADPMPHIHDGTEFVEETLQSDNWVVIIAAAPIGLGAFLEPLKDTLVALAAVLAMLCGGGTAWVLRRRISARSEILAGLRNHEFVVHYQPIIELATRRCVGAEALVRWRRPQGDLVRPDLFVPVAEDTGLISAITDMVVEAVIREAAPLLHDNRSMHVAINIPAVDITSGRIVGVMQRALEGSGIAPEQIWLEATERGFINTEGARSALMELRRRGHKALIDDFGTGYSSLQYLKDLPVDMLKIDKSFIETVGTAAATSQVTAHIIAMARELKLGLVAEGVETETQRAFLVAQKVELAQGWLFSPALPIDEFIAFCQEAHDHHDVPARSA